MSKHFHTRKRAKKVEIVRNDDGVVVGRSSSVAKAERSIAYREAGVKKSNQIKNTLKLKK